MNIKALKRIRERYEYYFLEDGQVKVFDHKEKHCFTIDLEMFMSQIWNDYAGMQTAFEKEKQRRKGKRLWRYYQERNSFREMQRREIEKLGIMVPLSDHFDIREHEQMK